MTENRDELEAVREAAITAVEKLLAGKPWAGRVVLMRALRATGDVPDWWPGEEALGNEDGGLGAHREAEQPGQEPEAVEAVADALRMFAGHIRNGGNVHAGDLDNLAGKLDAALRGSEKPAGEAEQLDPENWDLVDSLVGEFYKHAELDRDGVARNSHAGMQAVVRRLAGGGSPEG